jgi:predicted ATPase
MQREPEERCYEAELLRLREILLAVNERHDEACERLCEAVKVADSAGAKLFSLRAATCLARLWHNQGKRTVAGDLLTPIYAWFTEGFDAPDLQEAKALLEELAS